MSLYVDTSVLLKLCIDEPDSDHCEALLNADPDWVTGRHTLVEPRRNLRRLLGIGDDYVDALTQFTDDWPRPPVTKASKSPIPARPTMPDEQPPPALTPRPAGLRVATSLPPNQRRQAVERAANRVQTATAVDVVATWTRSAAERVRRVLNQDPERVGAQVLTGAARPALLPESAPDAVRQQTLF